MPKAKVSLLHAIQPRIEATAFRRGTISGANFLRMSLIASYCEKLDIFP